MEKKSCEGGKNECNATPQQENKSSTEPKPVNTQDKLGPDINSMTFGFGLAIGLIQFTFSFDLVWLSFWLSVLMRVGVACDLV